MKTANTPSTAPGFSLLELLIAMSILVILASVAVPTYTNYQTRARATEFTMAVTPFKSAMAEWALLNPAATAWPESQHDLGWTDYSGDYVREVIYRRASNPLTAAIVVSGVIDEKPIRLLYQGQLQGGRVRWQCTAHADSLQYLPRTCSGEVAPGL